MLAQEAEHVVPEGRTPKHLHRDELGGRARPQDQSIVGQAALPHRPTVDAVPGDDGASRRARQGARISVRSLKPTRLTRLGRRSETACRMLSREAWRARTTRTKPSSRSWRITESATVSRGGQSNRTTSKERRAAVSKGNMGSEVSIPADCGEGAPPGSRKTPQGWTRRKGTRPSPPPRS